MGGEAGPGSGDTQILSTNVGLWTAPRMLAKGGREAEMSCLILISQSTMLVCLIHIRARRKQCLCIMPGCHNFDAGYRC